MSQKENNNIISITYSFISGGFLSVINTQLVKIVSITNVLKSEWVNIRIAQRRKELNGEKTKQAGEELNRKIVLFRFTTTNTYE